MNTTNPLAINKITKPLVTNQQTSKIIKCSQSIQKQGEKEKKKQRTDGTQRKYETVALNVIIKSP